MTSRVDLYTFKSVASTHARVRRLSFTFTLGLKLGIHKKVSAWAPSLGREARMRHTPHGRVAMRHTPHGRVARASWLAENAAIKTIKRW